MDVDFNEYDGHGHDYDMDQIHDHNDLDSNSSGSESPIIPSSPQHEAGPGEHQQVPVNDRFLSNFY